MAFNESPVTTIPVGMPSLMVPHVSPPLVLAKTPALKAAIVFMGNWVYLVLRKVFPDVANKLPGPGVNADETKKPPRSVTACCRKAMGDIARL